MGEVLTEGSLHGQGPDGSRVPPQVAGLSQVSAVTFITWIRAHPTGQGRVRPVAQSKSAV